MLIIHKKRRIQSKKKSCHKGNEKVTIFSRRGVYYTTFISNANKNESKIKTRAKIVLPPT